MINLQILLRMALCTPTLLLLSCEQSERPGEVETFDGIADDDVINLVGTEPFWSMEIKQGLLLYTTPVIPGEPRYCRHFAGNNGLGISGELGSEALQIAVTPGECSDGMSDRTYPFTATVSLAEQQLNGCGYTSSTPFSGDPAP